MSFELLLIGAGGHCRSCIDVIGQEGRFNIVGIVDKTGEAESGKRNADVMVYPLIGTDDDLPDLRKKFNYALVTHPRSGGDGRYQSWPVQLVPGPENPLHSGHGHDVFIFHVYFLPTLRNTVNR